MRKNRSPNASKKYPELHKFPDSPYWYFRKFSKEKGKELVRSTKIRATESNAAAAYKAGIALFNEWIASSLPSGRAVLIKDLARVILIAKETSAENTYRSTKNQFKNHILPAFGHLRPDQITRLRWETYQSLERKKGTNRKLFNTRKALREILHRAHEEGMIRQIPKLPLDDAQAAPPKYIPIADMRRILHRANPRIKLLVYIMWKQGPRPGEALQYRYSMIKWNEGTHGMLDIPASITKTKRARKIPLNSRVARVLKWLDPNSAQKIPADDPVARKLNLLAPRVTSDFIFPSPDSDSRPMNSYAKAFRRACEAAGPMTPGKRKENGAKGDGAGCVLNYTIYNVRDTFITNALKRGLSSTFVAKYCDTSSGMIDRKYAVAERSVMERVAE